MTADTTFDIPIPLDPDGFIFLQRTLCGEYFELTPKDLEDESQLRVWCPKCGLTPDSLSTDEVMELAMKIVNNHVSDLLNGFGKNLSKSSRNGSVKLKLGPKIKRDPVDSTISKLDNLELQVYDRCHREAKTSPSLKMEGEYCSFRGEIQDGD